MAAETKKKKTVGFVRTDTTNNAMTKIMNGFGLLHNAAYTKRKGNQNTTVRIDSECVKNGKTLSRFELHASSIMNV